MKQNTVIMKFGGTSLMSTGRIRDMAIKIAHAALDKKVVAVVSAMGKTTDDLARLARQITTESFGKEMDILLSAGEQISISLMCMALKTMGVDAVSMTGAQADILTDSNFGCAGILDIDPARIKKHLSRNRVVIVAGFQGRDMHGNVTTLGRGGSDTTAVALAAVLKASLCEIYTDVDGVFTADPRIVPNARKIDVISHEEMMELAGQGARVMSLRAMDWAYRNRIPLVVRSSFSDAQGTIIKETDSMEKARVTGIAHSRGICRISITGIKEATYAAAEVFELLRDIPVALDMIVMNKGPENTRDFSFTINDSDLVRVLPAVQEASRKMGSADVKYDPELAAVSVIGKGIKQSPRIPAAVFDELRKNEIEVHMVSTSEIRLTCIVSKDKLDQAIRAVHNRLIINKC
jgi:aspartate kinase